MTAPIGFPEAVRPLEIPEVDRPSRETPATPFVDRLQEVVEEANQSQRTAETQARDFADGRSNDVHGTMIGLAQADIQLRLVASIRNRVIEAYREVMRMGA